ncbi:ribosomal protein L11 methyltransferase [Parabacteroides sp. PF5-5]|uniref:50S ribosomal protein L11 methyltransferase n=1 Tax=unclassified Parabacteroides TaxID=2649774 RepID=UPI0024732DB4|nr:MULTISPECIES: 50S ribosomal protein L11 methyltransferase [unclassified Parabacteroides]MDH6304234.1 ribosomal protein L11 methyltransferase [Parabacteroides sp. PH5-39]MDH6315051.1 ribosomal protein L11 methyltransferase [Parabacteroides sp. PF5-13]MDH6318711.1 ribosomal protein L11 methyltransferase [Parabacteroides sp. PH5-13]MDH6322441.1 ribosomal protein L11 methyltransferase [Parabacteroides sp. PH5-8]MDH6326424.1 ribosomal protein L11 methyltransferase [Parabacteroides sp. PH5-41]
MNYYELEFTYTSPTQADIINDILAAELGEIGFESFTETENGLLAYIQEKLYDKATLEEKLSAFPLENVSFHFSEKRIESKDWNEEWEKNYFKPIAIDEKCIIHASFHQVSGTYAYDIVIDPKMAFGTGNHETTYLMLQEMLALDLEGKELLDMGCGTAVLAILAAMKGAKRVVAIDIDEWAYNNALENIRLNNTNDIQVLLGGAEQIQPCGSFDIVFANINRNILLNDIPHYAACMKPGALLYMSGFYTEDIPALEAACTQNGLSLVSHTERNNWASIKVKK